MNFKQLLTTAVITAFVLVGGVSVAQAAEAMTITTDVPEFTVNEPDTFTVGTIANGDAGKKVRAHFTIPDGATVEYQEVGSGDWLPLTDVFGPPSGFPLGDITTTFRGTFSKAESQIVPVEFRTVDGNELLGSKDITATVVAPVKNNDTGEVFSTIQNAIDDDDTVDGHTIQVEAGTYSESVLIDKPLSLLGPNHNISAVNGTRLTEAVITEHLRTNVPAGVTVSGFEFTNIDAPNFTINVIGDSDGFTFENNRFIDNTKVAIKTGLTRVTNNITIEGNLVDNVTGSNQSGMQLGGVSGESSIANNKIIDTAYGGIIIDGADGLTISGNQIDNIPQQGIQLAGAIGDVTIDNNTITNANTEKKADKGAIRIYGSGVTGSLLIKNNTISGGHSGVAIKDGENITGKDITVTNNSITGLTSGKAIYNGGTGELKAEKNWWGISTSPSGLVSDNVTFDPWFTNVAMTTLSDAVVFPDGGSATLAPDTPEVVVTDSSQALTITAGSIADASIDYSSLVTDDSNETTGMLPATTINSDVANVTIPADTTVTGPTGWDGVIDLPSAGSSSGTAPSGFSVGGTVIEIGSADGVLIFSSPVTITLPGVTGTVAYKPTGSTVWTQITDVCSGDYANPDAPTEPDECSTSNGTDTKIVTYHFTSFGELDPAPASSGGGGGQLSSSDGGDVAGEQDTDGDGQSDSSDDSADEDGEGQVLGVQDDDEITDQELRDLLAQAKQALLNLAAQIGGENDYRSCSYVWTRDLGQGAQGADVMNLQKFLNMNANTRVALSGVGSAGQETSYYGPLTAAAVSKFQSKHASQILTPLSLTQPTGYFGGSSRAQSRVLCASDNN